MSNTISYSDWLDFLGLDRPATISDDDFELTRVTFDREEAWYSDGGQRTDVVGEEAEAFAARRSEYDGDAEAAFEHWRSLTA